MEIGSGLVAKEKNLSLGVASFSGVFGLGRNWLLSFFGKHSHYQFGKGGVLESSRKENGLFQKSRSWSMRRALGVSSWKACINALVVMNPAVMDIVDFDKLLAGR